MRKKYAEQYPSQKAKMMEMNANQPKNLKAQEKKIQEVQDQCPELTDVELVKQMLRKSYWDVDKTVGIHRDKDLAVILLTNCSDTTETYLEQFNKVSDSGHELVNHLIKVKELSNNQVYKIYRDQLMKHPISDSDLAKKICELDYDMQPYADRQSHPHVPVRVVYYNVEAK